MDNISTYLSGRKLYGDDFDFEQIRKWYEKEQEAYADLGSGQHADYTYHYHLLNRRYGYKYLPEKERFSKAMGLGAAYGSEFYPLKDRLDQVYILEPSEQLRAKKIGDITPVYKKPSIDGKIDFSAGYFDLITCFGTLHHIPNVSFVLSELYRVLKPGGFLLLREPVISMGDWRKERPGLTRNERGLPGWLLRKKIRELGLEVIHEGYCFTATAFIQRKIGHLLKQPVYAYPFYLAFDKFISRLLKWNIRYHPENIWQRLAPQSVFYVLKK